MVGIASVGAALFEEPREDGVERPNIFSTFGNAKGELFVDPKGHNDNPEAQTDNAEADTAETEALEHLDLDPYNITFRDIILGKVRAGLDGEATDRVIERMQKLGIKEAEKLRAYLFHEIQRHDLSDNARTLMAILSFEDHQPQTEHKPTVADPAFGTFHL